MAVAGVVAFEERVENQSGRRRRAGVHRFPLSQGSATDGSVHTAQRMQCVGRESCAHLEQSRQSPGFRAEEWAVEESAL
jgi:hypothetical protein